MGDSTIARVSNSSGPRRIRRYTYSEVRSQDSAIINGTAHRGPAASARPSRKAVRCRTCHAAAAAPRARGEPSTCRSAHSSSPRRTPSAALRLYASPQTLAAAAAPNPTTALPSAYRTKTSKDKGTMAPRWQLVQEIHRSWTCARLQTAVDLLDNNCFWRQQLFLETKRQGGSQQRVAATSED